MIHSCKNLFEKANIHDLFMKIKLGGHFTPHFHKQVINICSFKQVITAMIRLNIFSLLSILLYSKKLLVFLWMNFEGYWEGPWGECNLSQRTL